MVGGARLFHVLIKTGFLKKYPGVTLKKNSNLISLHFRFVDSI